MLVQTWGDVIVRSLQNLWIGIATTVPNLIAAVIVFVIGWVIANAFDKVVRQGFKALKVDQALESLGVEAPLSRAGFKLDSGAFLGTLVRWFFILVFLLAAFDVMSLTQVTAFLRDILNYIPQVIVAALILLAAALLADTAQRVVSGAAKATGMPSSGFLGGVAKWAIWIFGILTALYQLGIAGPLVQTVFTAFVAMLALAGGLAFGFGGKDAAARYIDRLRQDISNHH